MGHRSFIGHELPHRVEHNLPVERRLNLAGGTLSAIRYAGGISTDRQAPTQRRRGDNLVVRRFHGSRCLQSVTVSECSGLLTGAVVTEGSRSMADLCSSLSRISLFGHANTRRHWDRHDLRQQQQSPETSGWCDTAMVLGSRLRRAARAKSARRKSNESRHHRIDSWQPANQWDWIREFGQWHCQASITINALMTNGGALIIMAERFRSIARHGTMLAQSQYQCHSELGGTFTLPTSAC